MKCFTCKQEIVDESKMKLISPDGDFACNENCENKFNQEKEEFFNNIHNDQWYNTYMNEA